MRAFGVRRAGRRKWLVTSKIDGQRYDYQECSSFSSAVGTALLFSLLMLFWD